MPELSEELFPEVGVSSREPLLLKRISHYAGRGEGKKERKETINQKKKQPEKEM